MIQETLITSINSGGFPHIAPMGIAVQDQYSVIMPFKPNATLDNILANQTAVINYCDDVRVFAGCITGRRNWPLKPAAVINGYFLSDTLAHAEVVLEKYQDDPVRPKLFCTTRHLVNHKPFKGFNRAQSSVLEAAILVSRLGRLPWNKIAQELKYLQIAIEKTAGPNEMQAWRWLIEYVELHTQSKVLL